MAKLRSKHKAFTYRPSVFFIFQEFEDCDPDLQSHLAFKVCFAADRLIGEISDHLGDLWTIPRNWTYG